MAENRHDPHTPHDVKEPERPVSPFEEKDVDVWAVGRLGIALALICVVCLALLFGLFRFFESETGGARPAVGKGIGADAGKLPPAPRLEETPILDLQEMRAAEDQVLNSYAWVDKQNGVVRIPIDRAIDLLAQRGLPARQQNGPQSAASGVSVPTESGLGPKVQQAGGPLALEGK
ncbi:MAG TPA: hypothetical protein VG456_11975 [Candidatus Sulfopaludibacter sp.]|jgi:hypothetical protein|nr:hypothetical protein [Candidatus Sulfopaludibacter sp.]